MGLPEVCHSAWRGILLLAKSDALNHAYRTAGGGCTSVFGGENSFDGEAAGAGTKEAALPDQECTRLVQNKLLYQTKGESLREHE